jgi:4-azaleucine resistance transporter AzlC
MTTKRSEFLTGIKDILPILMGVIPFGLIYGVSARGAGIAPTAAQAMSFIVFAGSAQFVTAQLIGAAVPGGIIILTAVIINLRHALYSASVAPYLKRLHPLWQLLLAYLLTDEAYAVTITHYQQRGDTTRKHWYFLGAGLALWSTWQISTAIGVVLGAQVPASWSLDFTLPLTFIALVVPILKDRAGLAAALAAGSVAVLAAGLPLKFGLIIATLIGITIGMCLESKGSKQANVPESEEQNAGRASSHAERPEITPAGQARKDSVE